MKTKGRGREGEKCLAIIVFFNYKKQRDNYTAIIELQKLDLLEWSHIVHRLQHKMRMLEAALVKENIFDFDDLSI